MKIEKWKPEINWDSPAGKTLLAFVAVLPRTKAFNVTVFGSAPLQLSLDASFLSADVDIIADEDFSDLIREHGLGKSQREIYIEQCAANTFAVGTDWPLRAYTEQVQNVLFSFPHPIDILVSKLARLEPKDIRAFQLVLEKTGMPTEEQLKFALRGAVDLYKPSFDEERAVGDIRLNTLAIWRILYQKEINVVDDIIRPALDSRRAGYGETSAGRKARLGGLKPDDESAQS